MGFMQVAGKGCLYPKKNRWPSWTAFWSTYKLRDG